MRDVAGIYGFPVERAMAIAFAETKRFLETNTTLVKVLFVCFEERVYEAYRAALEG